MEKDPICGMEVDPDKAEFKSIEKDKTYYFCSEACLNKFLRREHPIEIKKKRKKQDAVMDIPPPDEGDKKEKAEEETENVEIAPPEGAEEEKEEKKDEGKTDEEVSTGEPEVVKAKSKKAKKKHKNTTDKKITKKVSNKKTAAPKKEKLDKESSDIAETTDKEEKQEEAEEKETEKEKPETAGDVKAEPAEKPAEPEKPAPGKEIILIEGMTCSSCVATIEKALSQVKGVKKAEVNFASEKALVEFDPEMASRKDLVGAVVGAGYKTVEEKPNVLESEEKRQKRILDYSRLKVISAIIIALPLLYLGMAPHFSLPTLMSIKTLAAVEMILALAVMAIGYQFYTRGVWAVIKTGKANMETLVAVGTAAAFFYSLSVSIMIWKGDMLFGIGNLYYEVAGVLVAVILLGRHMEASTKGRVSHAVTKLIQLQPNEAFVVRGKDEYRVKISEVKKGDIVIVEPGQRVPVDGVVVSGQSAVDMSIVTGEPLPVEVKKGSKVVSGTINKTGTFKFKATKVGAETFLSQVIKLVEEAQGSKAPIQKLADKVASVFVPAVIGIALVAGIVWYILAQQLGFPLLVFVAVLIIACPCALGLATPTAVMMGIGMAAQRGILIKNAVTLQKTKDIDVVVLDKTGTVTEGKPMLTNYIGIGKFPKDAVLQYAAIVERRSEHPIGKAIVALAEEQKMSMPEPKSFKVHPGKGVEGVHSGKKILLGNIDFVKKHVKIDDAVDKIEYYSKQGKTVMVLAVDKKVAGVIAVADTIREGTVEAVEQMKAAGKEVVLLTGDNKKTAEAIARQAGIDTVIAKVLPEEKEKKVKELQSQGKKVAMVGDGINDAPAMSAADLGIAMGNGTDIAVEAADVILVRNDLRDVVRAFKISAFTLTKIKQNLFWALVYNSIGIPVAAGVLYPFTGWLLNPMIAGVAMGLSSISVVGNSLLMKGYKV